MKRKRKNKLIALVLAVSVFVCGLIIPGSAADISTEPMLPVNLPDQRAALAANELLWQTFTLGEDGMPIAYPEEYGGAFIDGELLYIYIVGLNDELEDKYMEICKGSPVVRFLEADYSANYLMTLYDVVESYVGEYEITGFGIDFRNNRFNVELNSEPNSELTQEYKGEFDTNEISAYDVQKNELSETLNNSAITIVAGTYMQTTDAEYALTGGTTLIGRDDAENILNAFSLCITGTIHGKPAILTAGHCITRNEADNVIQVPNIYWFPNDENIGAHGIKIAEVAEDDDDTIVQFKDNEVGDYAIIPLSSSAVQLTNDAFYLSTLNTINITSRATAYVSGQYLGSFGNGTYRVGVLHSYGYSFYSQESNATLLGMCKIDINNDEANWFVDGESGGIIYSNNCLYGIISGFGKRTDEVPPVFNAFTPISVAVSKGFNPQLT